MTATSQARNGFLDFLRALAIVLVVNCHLASAITSHGTDEISASRLRAFGVGGHGVDLFFVLSGWLLGGILFKELRSTGTIRLGRFYGRRWLRTLPAYYAILLPSVLQRWMSGTVELSDATFVVFLQTYYYDLIPFFGVSWSLCVEEHFYLLIAPLLVLWGRTTRSAIILLSALVIVPLVLRWLGWFGNLNQTHVRIDQCATGVALAYLYTAHPKLWMWLQRVLPAVVVVSLVTFVALIVNRTTLQAWDFPLVGYTAIFAAWICLAERSDYWREFGRGWTAIGYVATRSYALYLVHVEAIALTNRFGIEPGLRSAMTTWAIALLLAEILYRFIELPGMSLRSKIPFLRSTKNVTGNPQ